MIDTTISLKAPPGLLQMRSTVERARQNALNGVALSVKADFGVTVQTWDHKPVFEITSPASDRRRIAADMTGKPGEIFGYVSGGTSVRYATMGPAYVRKSVPGFIGSFPGGGLPLFISRLHPRPGIQARRFASTITAKWQKEAPATFQRAIDAEIKRGP